MNKPSHRAVAASAETNIAEVISAYVQLTPTGKLLRGLCPFHDENTPSFTVYPHTHSWFCFGCRRGGDAIEFIKLIEHVGFKDAVKRLESMVAGRGRHV